MFGSERWLGKFAFQDLHNLHSSKYTLYLFWCMYVWYWLVLYREVVLPITDFLERNKLIEWWIYSIVFCVFWWCLYCILASCYIRLTLNICYFVHQCNTFTSYFLLIVMFRPHAAIFRCYSILSRSWCSVMPVFAYVMLPAMC
jgi:hypothetical protein